MEEKSELVCEVCKQIVYIDEGKDPQAVLRGHQIRCKMLKRQEAEAAEAQQEPPQEKSEVEVKSKVKETIIERKKRIPFGAPRQKLEVLNQDPNYHYHRFNDNWRKEPDRIRRAMAAGYEKVEGDDPVTVGTNDDGTAIEGVLMRIPKEFYEEDRKAKEAELDRVDQEINRGSFQEKPGDKRYVPASGIHIETKLTP